MSPLEIKMLLHYHAMARDYRDEVVPEHANSNAVRETIESFRMLGLIEVANKSWLTSDPAARASEFRTTDKGDAMVEHLCAVQVPIIKWVQP